MPIRLGHFEKPDKLTKSDDSDNKYAKYAAEPFETGFGHTIGNSLRRVLLSSLEGAMSLLLSRELLKTLLISFLILRKLNSGILKESHRKFD